MGGRGGCGEEDSLPGVQDGSGLIRQIRTTVVGISWNPISDDGT